MSRILLFQRLIPVLLLRNGQLVQSKKFSRYQIVGNPQSMVQRLSDWACDELIYLDISQDDSYDLRREDLKVPNRHSIADIIKDVARKAFMPLTFGGKIRTPEDAAFRIKNGADKVSINTAAYKSPELITQIANRFGAQCVVVSIDAQDLGEGSYKVFVENGRTPTEYSPAEWSHIAEDRGAGEILINSIDRDGSRLGYDLMLIEQVVEAVNIPVIALGGVGEWEHFRQGLEAGASAAAAANIFYYTENSVFNAKSYLYQNHQNVREPMLMRI